MDIVKMLFGGRKKRRKFSKNRIYSCKSCGYHQGVSHDGRMRRCKGCGNFNW